jgi:hypothetical protein
MTSGVRKLNAGSVMVAILYWILNERKS